MNLIEELGIEKARAIVAGAPDGANEYSVWASLSYYKTVGERCELWKQHYKWWTPVLYNSYMKQHRRSLDDLRTSIANHGTDNLSHFTDNCSDIRNHVSPNTKVIEHE